MLSYEKEEVNPHDPSPKMHKLIGELEGLSSFSINYDIRVIFEFLDIKRVPLVDIGNHDKVH